LSCRDSNYNWYCFRGEGHYLQDVVSKIYLSGCGSVDERHDFAEYFDNRYQAYDYCRRYGLNCLNPPKTNGYYSIRNTENNTIIAAGLNKSSRDECITQAFMEISDQGSLNIKDKYDFVLGDIYEIIVTSKPIKY
ncbi:MAG TPA: hypothetical protein PKB02_12195, partial [Anaerohalosphaeraceae bacterium]|nr:hypothetical protein [Anaerohalosphaeraceae bacterium]